MNPLSGNRKIIPAAVFLLFISLPLFSQYGLARKLGLTLRAGPTFLFSDIGGYSFENNWLGLRDVSMVHPRFSYGVDAHYRLSKRFSARYGFTHGFLYATDEGSHMPDRGFQSKVSVLDNILAGEFYIFRNRIENTHKYSPPRGEGIDLIRKMFDLYVYSGFGVVFYSVTPNKPLSEARVPPVGSSVTIPAGIGTAIYISPSLATSIDFSGRLSLTDRIEGYPSEFSRANDIYYFFSVGLTWKISNGVGRHKGRVLLL